jgi:hypothetical protein
MAQFMNRLFDHAAAKGSLVGAQAQPEKRYDCGPSRGFGQT